MATAEHAARSVDFVMLLGHVIVGFSVSLTVTVKLHGLALMFPLASVAVQVTVVVPFENVEPEAGVQLAVAPGQLSFAVAV